MNALLGGAAAGVPAAIAADRAAPGDFRGRDAGATAELVRALLRKKRDFGITRLGSLTRLDRAGVCVAQAVRPLSLSNAVSQGKGTTLLDAAASALMEALETWAGENIPVERMTTAQARASGRGGALALRRLPRARIRRRLGPAAASLDRRIRPPRRPHRAGAGRAGRHRLHPPFATPGGLPAHHDGPCRRPHDARRLHPCDARDPGARAPWPRRSGSRVSSRNARSRSRTSTCRPRPKSSPACAPPISWRASGWCRPSTDLPTFRCHVIEGENHRELAPLPGEGFGCDFTHDRALAKALLEAAQARRDGDLRHARGHHPPLLPRPLRPRTPRGVARKARRAAPHACPAARRREPASGAGGARPAAPRAPEKPARKRPSWCRSSAGATPTSRSSASSRRRSVPAPGPDRMAGDIVVFLGPTLRRAEASALLRRTLFAARRAGLLRARGAGASPEGDRPDRRRLRQDAGRPPQGDPLGARRRHTGLRRGEHRARSAPPSCRPSECGATASSTGGTR